MKIKYLIIIAGLLMAVFCSGCGVSYNGANAKFKIFDPSVVLTDAELAQIGASGLAGTNEADTATKILNWQKAKMKLMTPTDEVDVSYAMRWNYIMPGIYPVNEMIAERTIIDGGTKKIYGVCWDYAAIYISVANKYGLPTRMTAWKKYISGIPGGEKGLGPDEYNALKIKLQKNNLSFSYDQIRGAARETWVHYRAEVKIGSNWISFDGADPTGEFADDSNYSLVNWDEGADQDLTVK